MAPKTVVVDIIFYKKIRQKSDNPGKLQRYMDEMQVWENMLEGKDFFVGDR